MKKGSFVVCLDVDGFEKHRPLHNKQAVNRDMEYGIVEYTYGSDWIKASNVTCMIRPDEHKYFFISNKLEDIKDFLNGI